MVEKIEAEIAQMEEDMQSQHSEAYSVKSKAQEILDQVAAEVEAEESATQQSKQQSMGDYEGEEEEEGDEEEDSDENDHNVFYKASELIVSILGLACKKLLHIFFALLILHCSM